MSSALGSQPLPILLLAILSLLLSADFAGRWLRGRWAKGEQGEPPDLGHIQTSVLGLLGLMVAFTFGMALDRFETRRNLVTQEANAIGTAHIRTAFAADPQHSQLKSMLEIYARNRLAYGSATGADRDRLVEEAEQLRETLATAGVQASQSAPSPPMGPPLMDSVNVVIDIGAERDVATLSHVPVTVGWLLLSYAVIAAALVGYSSAGKGHPIMIGNGVMLLLLTLTLVLIVDLDRPSKGTIRIDQYPMEVLVKSFSTQQLK